MLLPWSQIKEKDTRSGNPRIQIFRALLFSATLFGAIVPYGYSFMGVGSLTSTLSTHYSSACGGEIAHLSCPPPTLITVQYAKYGRSVPSSQMCGNKTKSRSRNLSRSLRNPLLSSTAAPKFEEDTRCVAVRSLEVMIDLCEDMPRCSVLASPETFTQDPCAGTTKYLEAHYKCRPNDTQRVTACEGQELPIRCKKGYKILVHSAMYGRSPEGSDKCPARKGGHIDCQSLEADKRVKRECNYNRSCLLHATANWFGEPCSLGIYKYLKVSYTCVPKSVLNIPEHIKKKLRNRRKNRRRKKKKKKTEMDIDTSVARDITTEQSRDQTTDQPKGRLYETYEQTSVTRILPLATEEPAREEQDKTVEVTTGDRSESRPPAEASSQTPDLTLGPMEILETTERSLEDPTSLRPWEDEMTTTSNPLLREEETTEGDVLGTEPEVTTSKEQIRERTSDSEDATSSRELDTDWLGYRVTDSPKKNWRVGPSSREVSTDNQDIQDTTSIETDTDPSVIIAERSRESGVGTDRSSSLLAAITSSPTLSTSQNHGRRDPKAQPKDINTDLDSQGVSSNTNHTVNKHHNDASGDRSSSDITLDKTQVPPKNKERPNRNRGGGSPYVTERNLTVLCVNFTGSKDRKDEAGNVDWGRIRRPRDQRTIGFLKDWFTVVHYLDVNEEKAWLYFTLGICFGIIVMLIVVLIRVCINFRRNIRARLDVSDPTHRSALINNHGSGPDPLDAPMLEHSDSIDRIEVVRFSPRSTLRSMRGGARENRDLVNYYG